MGAEPRVASTATMGVCQSRLKRRLFARLLGGRARPGDATDARPGSALLSPLSRLSPFLAEPPCRVQANLVGNRRLAERRRQRLRSLISSASRSLAVTASAAARLGNSSRSEDGAKRRRLSGWP